MPVNDMSPKVMVVDDEPMVRRFVSAVLSRSGYDVVDAETPEAAVLLLEGNPHFDLLVTDVVMPNVNGCELASRVLESLPGLRVLFMSGYEASGTCTATVPGSSFLRKPFRVPELLESVRQVLE
jgi:CheY-like chemotaxis protein